MNKPVEDFKKMGTLGTCFDSISRHPDGGISSQHF
jgi:hypothetical protein